MDRPHSPRGFTLAPHHLNKAKPSVYFLTSDNSSSNETTSPPFSEFPEPIRSKSLLFNGVFEEETLHRLISSINDALASVRHCIVTDFEPCGCKWKVRLVLDGIVMGPDEDEYFWIYAACCEKDYSLYSKLETHLALMPPKENSGSQQVSMAKNVFDNVCFIVEKEIKRLEFPKFPEGDSGERFKTVYNITGELNKGSHATVFVATHRQTKKTVAVKAILREKLSPKQDASIFNEISIMASLKHPQIIQLYDFFEQSDWYLLVMELMEGGDLFETLKGKRAYNESDARNICEKLLKAIHYCHENAVAHLDLKPKNFLLASNDDDFDIKLGDFGFAARITGPKCMTNLRGTPFYVAPEIVSKQPYDERADMWSFGVILYLLLGGTLPFMENSLNELFGAIILGKFEFPDDCFGNVSDKAKEVIQNLLVTDPEKRWTASQVMNSEWLREDELRLSSRDLSASLENLRLFNARTALKAAMIAVRWVSGPQSFICEEKK